MLDEEALAPRRSATRFNGCWRELRTGDIYDLQERYRRCCSTARARCRCTCSSMCMARAATAGRRWSI